MNEQQASIEQQMCQMVPKPKKKKSKSCLYGKEKKKNLEIPEIHTRLAIKLNGNRINDIYVSFGMCVCVCLFVVCCMCVCVCGPERFLVFYAKKKCVCTNCTIVIIISNDFLRDSGFFLFQSSISRQIRSKKKRKIK